MEQAGEGSARDLVLIGGSTGSIEALLAIVSELPADAPVSVFVVVHTTPQGPGMLPHVLSRAGGIPAVHAADGERFVPGKIYVAPPDHQMTLSAGDMIRVRRGPRENGHRPAIDPLLRSAAAEGYGPRSVAVILSGYLDDGSAGLYAMRKRGALSIIQSPEDAMAGDMPSSALRYAGAEFVLPAKQIGPKLRQLIGNVPKVIAMTKKNASAKHVATEKGDDNSEVRANELTAYPDEGVGKPSPFACPECHGVLWEIKEGGSVRYRCRVGHAYAESTLNEELGHAAERALWAAMRALEEKASMSRRMAETAGGPPHWKTRLDEQAQTFATHAEMLRKMILGEPLEAEKEAMRESMSSPGPIKQDQQAG